MSSRACLPFPDPKSTPSITALIPSQPLPPVSGALLLDLYSFFKLLWDRSGYPTVRGMGGKGGRIGNKIFVVSP